MFVKIEKVFSSVIPWRKSGKLKVIGPYPPQRAGVLVIHEPVPEASKSCKKANQQTDNN